MKPNLVDKFDTYFFIRVREAPHRPTLFDRPSAKLANWLLHPHLLILLFSLFESGNGKFSSHSALCQEVQALRNNELSDPFLSVVSVRFTIQGYRRLMDNGHYTLPTSHLASIEAMSADNNSVRHFLTSPGTPLKWGAQQEISLPDLHTQYWQFMLATGSSSRVNVAKFSKMMKELSGNLPIQTEIRPGNMVIYLGVGV